MKSARLRACTSQPSRPRTRVLHFDRVSTDGEHLAEVPDSGQADGTPAPWSAARFDLLWLRVLQRHFEFDPWHAVAPYACRSYKGARR